MVVLSSPSNMKAEQSKQVQLNNATHCLTPEDRSRSPARKRPENAQRGPNLPVVQIQLDEPSSTQSKKESEQNTSRQEEKHQAPREDTAQSKSLLKRAGSPVVMINLDDGDNASPRSNIQPDDNANNRTKDEESFTGDINQIMKEMNDQSNKTEKGTSKPVSAE